MKRTAFALVIGTAALLGACKPQETQSASQPAPLTATQLEALKPMVIDRILGNKDAKVTIIEFASYTCSHCGEFHRNTFPEIKKNYIDTGKVRFILRPMPLDNLALAVAKLTFCVPQDRYYNFAGAFFNSQNAWVPAPDRLAALKNIAQMGGMTSQQFDDCLKNEQVQKDVLAMDNLAKNGLNVTSTPSFYINGELVKGAQPFTEFAKIIDKKLAE